MSESSEFQEFLLWRKNRRHNASRVAEPVIEEVLIEDENKKHESVMKELVVEDEKNTQHKLSPIGLPDTQSGNHPLIQVSWENIKYKVITKNGCKKGDELKILHGLTGAVKPGQMLAILGGSGAGKSTLLDILAGRKGTGVIDGTVTYNGTSIGNLKSMVRRLTGYVTQEDILKPELTVKESLQFQAELRLNPQEFSVEQREAIVAKVMEQLKMTHRRDTRIGNEEKRGLSGGEKKRVAIGVELVSEPSVLFLDEPTSGLDAHNSLVVMKLLRELCRGGKTIICTIHQPRSTIYHLFDRVLFLNHGETVFFGSVEKAIPYFSSLGFDAPPYLNPADYFIDVLLSPDEEQPALSSLQLKTQIDFSKAYQNSPLAELVEKTLEDATQFRNLQELDDIEPFATSFLKQFKELVVRHLKGTMRNPMVSVVGLIQSVVMAVVVGSIFYQMGYTQTGIQGRQGALFFVMMFGAFTLMHFARAFVGERLLVDRERAAGVYDTLPYFLSRLIVDVPMQIVLPVLFTVIFYWMAGLNPIAGRFFILLGIMIMNSLCAGALFSLIGSLAPNVDVANVMVPGMLTAV